MNASLRMDDVYQRVLIQAVQALQVETVALGMVEGENLIYHAAAGQHAGAIIGKTIKLGKGIASMVIREGRGVVVSDVGKERQFIEEDKLGGVEMRALLIAPIQSQGRVIGVIEAINPISKTFDPDALLVMTGIGGLAGTTIQNAQLFERLQAAHKRYRDLFEESIDPIVITDWEGRIIEANHQASLLSGYSLEELQDLSIDQLHEVNWNKIGMEFESLRGDLMHSYESSLHKKDNSHIPAEVHARRVEFDSTDSIQWLLRDITERKELDNLREDLTSMIYHDLRSPLANIVSSLDVIAYTIPEQERETVLSILKIAENSTDRIQRLVNSLLDVSRLESGQPVADQAVVDTLALVGRALQDVEPSVRGRGQTLVVELPKRLPSLWVDEDMVRRVLINVVENSSKYSPSEGTIEVQAQAEDGWVHFSVKDQGSGIPPSEQDHIFEKFTRLQGENKAGGLGIGLAFCRLAVQGHGGRIWVESDTGKGSTFHFTVPIAIKKQLAAITEE
jgi:PAS domain S-box-containing protein